MKQPRVAAATCLAAALALTTIYSGRTGPTLLKWRAFSAELVAATDAVTRGPYLQMGTASSVVVRWRTNNPTDSQVAYGPDPSSLVWTATLAPLTIEHEVVVSGLLPHTKYYYAVGSTAQRLAGGDSDHAFVTSPPIGTAVPARIWVLGDSGTADANAAAVRNAYYSFAGSTPTNLWLMLGDNAYNAGLDTEYQAAVFDMFPSMLRQSVLWPTIGNHDIANTALGTGPYYSIFTLPKNGEAGGLPSGTEAYYSFDYGNIHFICLDSFDVDLTAGSPMMTWLQSDLASTSSRWTIAFWHHPPYSKGSHDSDGEYELMQMRQNALPLLEAGGVDLVLSGHSHSYERSFLIDGHYGRSATFSGTMKKDGGSGREDGTGAYRKPATIPTPHAGAVYAVAGSSGFAGGGALNHPAMYVSLNVMGSLVLDFNDGRLDARFIDNTSAVRDYFTILKEGVTPLVLTTASVAGGTVGTAYSGILAATGGEKPYTWSISDGHLPAGLSLNGATGAISGTPTTPGTAVFTILVRDNSAPQLVAERQFSVSIVNGPAMVSVPDVANLTLTAATAAITGVGLVVGTVTGAASATVLSGSVISQTPVAASQVAEGSAVRLLVSTGPAPAGPIVDAIVFSDGAGARTTPAFSTSTAGDVLLAFAACGGPSASPQTVTVSGAGLTWTLVRRANIPKGTSEIWRAKAVAKLTNVTVRSTPSVGGYWQSLTVVAFRGATGIGASAAANGLTGAPSVSLVTTRGNSLVYGVGIDSDRAVARTLGAGQVMVHQRLENAVGDTFWVQGLSAPVPAAGSSVRLNDTAPANDRWNFAGVEIVP